MPLETEIRDWDRKSKDAIASVYDRYCHLPDFAEQLVNLLADEDTESGASWLLKHHCEQDGTSLDDDIHNAVYRSANKLKNWPARLHILQCVDRMPVADEMLGDAEKFIRSGMVDEAKFVRAWAYSAFHELARHHPQYRPEALQLLGAALETETAGSVRARIRKRLKAGF